MKLLAIDSSGMVASVAVLSEDKLIGEYTINNKKTHSQTLLPMIDEMMKMIGMEIDEMDAIAIAAGPGSFTGLRIGSATAKGLAFALNKPIISVPTLEAMAYNLFGTSQLLCPIMDARNKQVFTGMYRYEGDKLVQVMEQTVMAVEDLCSKINEMNVETIFLGDGVDVYRDMLQEKISTSIRFAPAHLKNQRASAVAMCGFRLYQEGKVDTADSHVPEYLRLSQAEREMQEKLKKQAALREAEQE